MIDKTKIAILTSVANFELYKKSSQYFPDDIQKYVIDGTNGMHGIHSIMYMMRKLKRKGIEWLIMADEDVLFFNSDLVFSLIEEMNNKDITVCGVRDGGVIKHRSQSPWVINTFFSILNFKEVESIWDEKEVLQNQFFFENEFDDDLTKLKSEFDIKSLYEPYYCFYFWLRRKNKKILFLEAETCEDEISNSVLYKNEVLLYHTWYARSYGLNKKHTERINTILDLRKKNSNNSDSAEITIFKNRLFAIEQKIKKVYRRLSNKIVQ